MTKEQIKQKAEAEADKVIIGSGMDRASVIHLRHLLVTMYMQGATEATKELEKENAELKEINEGYCRNRDRLVSIGFPNFKDCKEYADQLTKAKKLLKKVVTDFHNMDCVTVHINKTIAEAEQFLSEVEK